MLADHLSKAVRQRAATRYSTMWLMQNSIPELQEKVGLCEESRTGNHALPLLENFLWPFHETQGHLREIYIQY